MKHVSIVLFLLATAIFGGLYAWARLREPQESQSPPSEVLIFEGPTKHVVTSEMALASRAMLDRLAPGFTKPATDGRSHRLVEMLRGGPVVLTFIKEGCPCSEAAQTFFNELHAAYPKASIRGVINGDAESAKQWAERFQVTYPLLLDAGDELVRGYGAENSAYVVIIDQKGRIAKHWPGYSEGMLRELGSLMAEMTGSAEKTLTFADAPTELYSGCPYDL